MLSSSATAASRLPTGIPYLTAAFNLLFVWCRYFKTAIDNIEERLDQIAVILNVCNAHEIFHQLLTALFTAFGFVKSQSTITLFPFTLILSDLNLIRKDCVIPFCHFASLDRINVGSLRIIFSFSNGLRISCYFDNIEVLGTYSPEGDTSLSSAYQSEDECIESPSGSLSSEYILTIIQFLCPKVELMFTNINVTLIATNERNLSAPIATEVVLISNQFTIKALQSQLSISNDKISWNTNCTNFQILITDDRTPIPSPFLTISEWQLESLYEFSASLMHVIGNVENITFQCTPFISLSVIRLCSLIAKQFQPSIKTLKDRFKETFDDLYKQIGEDNFDSSEFGMQSGGLSENQMDELSNSSGIMKLSVSLWLGSLSLKVGLLQCAELINDVYRTKCSSVTSMFSLNGIELNCLVDANATVKKFSIVARNLETYDGYETELLDSNRIHWLNISISESSSSDVINRQISLLLADTVVKFNVDQLIFLCRFCDDLKSLFMSYQKAAMLISFRGKKLNCKPCLPADRRSKTPISYDMISIKSPHFSVIICPSLDEFGCLGAAISCGSSMINAIAIDLKDFFVHLDKMDESLPRLIATVSGISIYSPELFEDRHHGIIKIEGLSFQRDFGVSFGMDETEDSRLAFSIPPLNESLSADADSWQECLDQHFFESHSSYSKDCHRIDTVNIQMTPKLISSLGYLAGCINGAHLRQLSATLVNRSYSFNHLLFFQSSECNKVRLRIASANFKLISAASTLNTNAHHVVDLKFDNNIEYECLQFHSAVLSRSSLYFKDSNISMNLYTQMNDCKGVEIIHEAIFASFDSSSHFEGRKRNSVHESDLDEFSGRNILFSSITFPAQLFINSSHSMGCAYSATYTMARLSDFSLNLDIDLLEHSCKILGSFSEGSSLGTLDARYSISDYAHFIDSVDEMGHSRCSSNQLAFILPSHPTNITTLGVESLDFLIMHKGQEVFTLGSKNIDYSLINYGVIASQTAVTLSDIKIVESSMSDVRHKEIVGNIHDSPSNTIDMHFTYHRGQHPLLEIRIEHLKLLYLFRSFNTLINLIRDHFCRGISNHLHSNYLQEHITRRECDFMLAYRSNNLEASTSKYNFLAIIRQRASGFAAYSLEGFPISGMFRFSCSFRQSEFHIPVSSNGSDSISILVTHGMLYKDSKIISKNFDSYCKGPYLARRAWLSDMKNVKVSLSRVLRSIFGVRNEIYRETSSKTIHPEFPIGQSNVDQPPVETILSPLETDVTWNIPIAVNDLCCDSTVPDPEPELNLDLLLRNVTICSWCNQNTVGDKMDLDINIICSPVVPEINGIHGPAYSSLNFETAQPGIRNKIEVEVSCNEINWIMAQGQYQAIVYMIQHNFGELQVVVPDFFIPPKPKIIYALGEQVYGQNSMESRLPMASTVPIHVRKGAIRVIENTPDYYELLQHPLKFMQDHRVSKQQDCESGLGRRISNVRRSKEILDTVTCCVPTYGYHNYHRIKLFARNVSNHLHLPAGRILKRNSGSDDNQRSHQRRNVAVSDIDDLDFQPDLGAPIIDIVFKGLEVDFYRKHFGGGNGIDVSATSFVIVDCTLSEKTVVSDDQKISPKHVIFAHQSAMQTNNMTEFDLNNSTKNLKSRNNVGSTVLGARRIRPRMSTMIPGKDTDLGSPHIRYSQQGIGNLRRCVVDISNSVFVVHILPIISVVNLFMEPILLSSHRNLSVLKKGGDSSALLFDFKAALDVEVHCKNTVFALPSISVKDGASGICVYGDLDYTQAWRGFLQTGPGKITLGLKLSLQSIFVAPLHQIRVFGVESLTEAMDITFSLEHMIIPKATDLNHHMSLLSPWMNLSSWIQKASKNNKSTSWRLMTIKVKRCCKSKHDDECRVSQGYDSDEDSDRSSFDQNLPQKTTNSCLPFKLSLKDLRFINRAVRRLLKAMKSKPDRVSLSNKFPVMWSSYLDIDHIPKLTYYLVHAKFQNPWDGCDEDVVVELSDIQIILRNNTYNLNVAKVEVSDFRFSFNKTLEKIHGAAGVQVGIWSFNDYAEVWEPIVEPVIVTAVAATDSTTDIVSGNAQVLPQMTNQKLPDADSITLEQNEFLEDNSSSIDYEKRDHLPSPSARDNGVVQSKVRIDVYSNPVEINAPLHAVTNLIRKVCLADIVTTSSADLPPYLIKNDLGVSVTCFIGIGTTLLTSETILIGMELPIEIHQLAKSQFSNPISKQTSGVNSDKFAGSEDAKEHLITISFKFGGECFQSKHPLPIDREGTTSFTVVNVKEDNSNIKQNTSIFSSSSQTSSFLSEDLPHVLLSMRIKEDGGREIVLRSMLSLKNTTNRPLSISLRRPDLPSSTASTYLDVGGEWNVPVQFAHPRSSLFLRCSDSEEWIEALPLLSAMVVQGSWSLPTKLRAELVSLSPGNPVPDGGMKISWILLMKPEARDHKSSNSNALIPIKFPSKEPYRILSSAQPTAVEGLHGPETSIKLDELYGLGFSSSTSRRNMIAKPVCLNLLPPLQICSVISQPLLYRLSDSDGFIAGEGVLLPGEIVDVHNLHHIFAQRIFISIRMVNYGWSKWSRVMSRSSPFSSTEKLCDINLVPLNLSNEGLSEPTPSNFMLPSLDVIMSIRESLIRLSCPILISNCSGLYLEYCDSGNQDMFIPQRTLPAINRYINIKKKSHELKADLESEAIELGKGLDTERDLYRNYSRDEYLQHSDIAESTPNFAENSNWKIDGTRNSTIVMVNEDASNTTLRNSQQSAPSLRNITVSNRSRDTVTVIIHLHSDHLRKIEVTAASDWTLAEVFAKLSAKVAVNPANQLISQYIFTIWSGGSDGFRKVPFSPSMESDMFGRKVVSSNSGDVKESQNFADHDDDPLFLSGLDASTGNNKIDASSSKPKKSIFSFGKSGTPILVKPPIGQNVQSKQEAGTEGETQLLPHFIAMSWLAADSELSSALPMSTCLFELKGQLCLRLVHMAEVHVWTQVAATSLVLNTRDANSFRGMFSRHKESFRTPYIRLENDVPFHPHKGMGFSSTSLFCLRTSSEGEWSDGIDISRPDIGANSFFISLNAPSLSNMKEGRNSSDHNWKGKVSPSYSKSTSKQQPGKHYEIALSVETGKGFFQNVSSICLVPKHILVSKLDSPIEIRQVGSDSESLRSVLFPGNVDIYHHPMRHKSKLLQIRRLLTNEIETESSTSGNPWCGEIDIGNIGIVFAKLVNPIEILKIQVEIVGASLVATFSLQNPRWPPYRIDNKTSFNMRFRQSLSGSKDQSKFLLGISAPSDDASNLDYASLHGEFPNLTISSLGWDSLSPHSSVLYAWDNPRSGGSILKVEFAQGLSWTSSEINLDELAKLKTVSLMRNLPNLGNPLAEGQLTRRLSNMTGDNWQGAYCILKIGYLYIFKDESRSDLLDIINLCSKKNQDISVASVERYFMKENEETTFSPFSLFTSGGTNSQYKSKELGSYIEDINTMRILILKLAEAMGMFDEKSLQITTALNNISMDDDEGDNDDNEDDKNDIDESDDDHDVDDDDGGDIADIKEECRNEATENGNSPYHSNRNSRDSIELSDEELEAQRLRFTIIADVMRSLSNDDLTSNSLSMKSQSRSKRCSSRNHRPNRNRKAASSGINIAHTYSIKEMLQKSFSVEQLLDMITSRPVTAADILSALVLIDAAMDDVEAAEIYQSLIRQKVIVPSSILVDPFAERQESGDVVNVPRSVTEDEADYEDHHQKNRTGITPATHQLIVTLHPPPLNPELLNFVGNDNYHEGSDPSENGLIYGFKLIIESMQLYFKCGSHMEYLGWLQSCRQSIESAWCHSMLGDLKDESQQLTMDAFKTKVSMRVLADGPTKVLTISEHVAEAKISRGNDSGMGPVVPGFDELDVTVEDIEEEIDRSSPDTKLSRAKKSAITDSLSVSIIVQSLCLSVIDNEPTELAYLALQDIEMTIDRSHLKVRMAATVQSIQIDNQLLNPAFQVALFPKRSQSISFMTHGTGSGSGSGSGSETVGEGRPQLMLPGLHQRGTGFPSLHLFFQQKYHTKSELAQFKESQESKLLYFDMFSLWIAPMQVDLDEELFVKSSRYYQTIRNSFRSRPQKGSTKNEADEELLALLYQGNRSWGNLAPETISKNFVQLLSGNQSSYKSFDLYAKPKRAVYFSLLQLHPLDIVLHLRPSPDFPVTSTEVALISVISQLDSARIQLNALIAEHAFGSTSLITEVISKHYKAALWKQFQKLLGRTDIVEGSVGLVANLGTGVYDLFYEPIDGLLGENGSFLDGLSKGGKSLASKTIGGTSAFTSKITGGIGSSVSFLTLDSDFQRSRSKRRLVRTSNLSEGIYLGTRELGSNIVEGVTGIVVSPYRGWEEGGGVGFGMGIAKGLLGVALKPAVGVFDLASRATEGIRNTALSTNEKGLDRIGILRTRIPRSFGRSNTTIIYTPEDAAAQYIIDFLTEFKREPRFYSVYHAHFIRKLGKSMTNGRNQDVNISNYEAWGMPVNKSYIAYVSTDRVALVQVNSDRHSKVLDASFVWSCPAERIEQLFSDNRGDLILNVNVPVTTNGLWNGSSPVMLEKRCQDYITLQTILEQVVGQKFARCQTLQPRGGLINTDVLKRYASGIRSFMLSPTKHTFQLKGCVLYEYTSTSLSTSSKRIDGQSQQDASTANSSNQTAITANMTGYQTIINEHTAKSINSVFGGPLKSSLNSSGAFIGSNNTNDDLDEELIPDGFLSFVYPLVDVSITGPVVEDMGRSSISIARKDGQKMRALKRDDEESPLVEVSKATLTLIFPNRHIALNWKSYLDMHVVSDPPDIIEASSISDDRSILLRSILSSKKQNAAENESQLSNSILGMLVIPCSCSDSAATESLKIEIARTLSNIRN